jgi:hypothetical protein
MMATSISRLNVLGPEDLRLASDAFEAALHGVNEQTSDIHPYTARQVLARYIIGRALHGERDPTSLRDRALSYLAELSPSPVPKPMLTVAKKRPRALP